MTAVMPLAERSVLASKASATLRSQRCRERQELRRLTGREFVLRILDPSPELASFRLRELLAPVNTRRRPIPGFGPGKFDQVLVLLRRRGCSWADPGVRLRQLSTQQRRQLARAVMDTAPKAWSGVA